MKAIAAAAALMLAFVGVASGQEGAPTGEERAAILKKIEEKYPGMPEKVAGYLADVREQFTREARCEMIDWFASAPNGVEAAAVETAQVWSKVCMLATEDITPEVAAAKLAGKRTLVDINGDVMTVLARSTGQPIMCCAPQVDLVRLGDTPYWARRVRLAALDQAFMSVVVLDPQAGDLGEQIKEAFVWRGRDAPKAFREIPFDELKGKIEKSVIESRALREKRRVSVYLPPGWSKDRTWPAVFIGDGGHGNFFPSIEAMIEDGVIEPVILIGVEAGWEAKVDADPALEAQHPDMRNSEYMPNFEGAGDLFDRHLKYFADEVTAWAAQTYNVSTRREDRVVSGFSGGGTFALFAGLRRPDVFGYSIPLSPAYTLPQDRDLKTGQRAVFRISGGLYEPDFHLSAKRNAERMKAAGYDVVASFPASGHFPDHWKLAFGNAMKEFFPNRQR